MILFDNPGTPTDEEWGTYCRHGVKIVEKDPRRTDSEGYPAGRIVEPWPCDQGCTREQLIADMEAEEDAYWASLWDEYRAAL